MTKPRTKHNNPIAIERFVLSTLDTVCPESGIGAENALSQLYSMKLRLPDIYRKDSDLNILSIASNHLYKFDIGQEPISSANAAIYNITKDKQLSILRQKEDELSQKGNTIAHIGSFTVGGLLGYSLGKYGISQPIESVSVKEIIGIATANISAVTSIIAYNRSILKDIVKTQFAKKNLKKRVVM